ncbi:MAG TPA: hypothetical protein VGG89_17635 [Candidatus Baltobacteraceae bacterium]
MKMRPVPLRLVSGLLGLGIGIVLSACGGGVSTLPPAPSALRLSTPGVVARVISARGAVYDSSSTGCIVSYDGVIWYEVPSGTFPPIAVKTAKCGASDLSSHASPPRPTWSVPHGKTQTRFIATSLTSLKGTPPAGQQSIETAAHAAGVPVSWLVYNAQYLDDIASYNDYHRTNGDDIEANANKGLFQEMRRDWFPWFVPTVSVEGVSRERNISGLMALGLHAFWGIAWNSHGVDGTYDYGAPWGSYCADPTSYKRPDPNGSCPLLAFEWTARDLTRAYLSGHEEYFSTDPDDLQQRARFSAAGAQTYIRAIADSYAAAGETQPIVMMSQQESGMNTAPGDAAILAALYDQAATDGMVAESFVQAVPDAAAFSAAPRAVPFPFIPGGFNVPSPILNGGTLYPATIDYHDDKVGMTFLAGHTLPTRMFRYAVDRVSRFNVPFPTVPASLYPKLEKAVVSGGNLVLQFQAPVALRVGIALWSDPRKLGITQSGAIAAGRAGEVVVFNLKKGPNRVRIGCPGCNGTTLAYSL